jgi:hypothetical protein
LATYPLPAGNADDDMHAINACVSPLRSKAGMSAAVTHDLTCYIRAIAIGEHVFEAYMYMANHQTGQRAQPSGISVAITTRPSEQRAHVLQQHPCKLHP